MKKKSTFDFDSISKGGNKILKLDPQDVIVRREDNSRVDVHDEDSINEMVETLKREGQLQPVSIRPDAVTGKPVLTFGFRRHAATLKMRETNSDQTIDCVQRDYEDYQEAWLANVAENSQRKNTTVIDDGKIVRRMTDPVADGGFGMTQAEAAKRLSKSQGWVSRNSRLLDLPDVVQDFIAENRVQLNSASVLVDATKELHDEVLSGKVVLSPETLKARRVELENELLEAGIDPATRANTKAAPQYNKEGEIKAKPGPKKKKLEVQSIKDMQKHLHMLIANNDEGSILNAYGVMAQKYYNQKLSHSGFCRQLLTLVEEGVEGADARVAEAKAATEIKQAADTEANAVAAAEKAAKKVAAKAAKVKAVTAKTVTADADADADAKAEPVKLPRRKSGKKKDSEE